MGADSNQAAGRAAAEVFIASELCTSQSHLIDPHALPGAGFGNRIELYPGFNLAGATCAPFPDPRSYRIHLAGLAKLEGPAKRLVQRSTNQDSSRHFNSRGNEKWDM